MDMNHFLHRTHSHFFSNEHTESGEIAWHYYNLFSYFLPIITFPVFGDSKVRRGISFGSVRSISRWPLFLLCQAGIFEATSKQEVYPSQIPPVCWPGPRLISDEIHPVLSQKTLDQGWRDWLMRGSVYLLCQLNLSAGGWLTYCSQHTMGRLTRCNYKEISPAVLQTELSNLGFFCTCHEPIRIWRCSCFSLNTRNPFLKFN